MTQSDTRQQILAAAGEQFAALGFRRATVRQICEKAGANLAAVNYHFRDKEGLYTEVVRQAHQDLTAMVPMPEWSDDTPPETKLRQFIHTFLTRITLTDGSTWQIQLMLREIMQTSAACKQLVEEHIRPQSLILRQIVDQLVADSTPGAVRQKIAFSIIGQCMHYRVAGPVVRLLMSDADLRSEFSTEKLTDHITRFTLSALGHSAYFPTDLNTSPMNPVFDSSE